MIKSSTRSDIIRWQQMWDFILSISILCTLSKTVAAWQVDLAPTTLIHRVEPDSEHRFLGNTTVPDYFKILLSDGDSLIIGARNAVHNISLTSLRENRKIVWHSSAMDKHSCGSKSKSLEECQNFIRVLVKKNDNELIVCGTNAYKPKCRTYRTSGESSYEQVGPEESGVAKCPYDPKHNNTAIYTDGKLYTGTVVDFTAREPLVFSAPLRTEQHDSQVLNDPDFVSSYDYGENVYFFFRETAVEHINCGKARYSRVARVCKNDRGGGSFLRPDSFTSFFKTRLNCSIPGEFPFFFDEIQSTSEPGLGGYKASLNYNERTDMIYAVFSTPQNSITGSAVCAFKFSDIIDSFNGQFKEQASPMSNWLPVDLADTPSPHPAKCVNDSKLISDRTLNFIRRHTLMDKAVPAYGGGPLLLQTSFVSRFTQIAIDWQVPAASEDNLNKVKYYDVMFVGTDDGKVLKVINVGDKEIKPVIIEEIQVFDSKTTIVNLKVYRKPSEGIEKLVIVAEDEIKTIPLHRCHLRKTCGECVALRDPYCSWTENRCENSMEHAQNVVTGKHPACGTSEPPIVVEEDNILPTHIPRQPANVDPTIPNHIDAVPPVGGPLTGASQSAPCSKQYSVAEMAAATVVCIVLSIVIGFFIGYRASLWRNKRSNDPPTYAMDKCLGTPKMQNRYNTDPQLNSETQHYFSPEVQKQLNVVLNLTPKTQNLPNGGVESKVHKVKKVYL
ncbi:unnamed protein product [Owenia fusiformis]|uniref:Sema domain-containing protein n=1 Tax=Owenia fusiformis TaxID=6347 RepID=A0A8S4PU30_OWEFU|nr:unnamed protein product [Owenia fusiformis]